MPDCSICCEKINVSNHKKVTCPFCDFTSCRSCVQKYLLSTSSDPHCMGCKNLWSREVVDGACTKVFRDTQLKKHRETILFEREKCLLPQAQEAASRVVQSRAIDKKIIELQNNIASITSEIHKLTRKKNSLLYDRPTESEEKEKRVFVRKCPVADCRGFLSTRWKCQICENNICPDCNEVKTGDTHTCDPNSVETVALLKKDTKPCPKCGTMIFKISGCSQMWCPDCHTAFDWNTMKIDVGRIHNPHYYEFQRTGKANPTREHGDIPCGGIPHLNELLTFFQVSNNGRVWGVYKYKHPSHEEFFKIHRLVTHIQNYEINRNPINNADNTNLRVSYLLNDISEDQMKFVLQKNEKAREKMRDRNNLLQMFVDVTGDLLRQMILKTVTLQECLDNVTSLRDYTRDAFTTIHKRYNCVTDWISENWEFEKNRYQKPPQVVVE